MLNDRDDLGTPVAISTMAFEQCLWQDTIKCSRHDKAWQTTVTACRHRLKLGIAWDALFEHLESCTISYNLDDAVVIVAHGLRDALAITCTYWTQHDTTWHCPCILCVVFCASIFRELRRSVHRCRQGQEVLGRCLELEYILRFDQQHRLFFRKKVSLGFWWFWFLMVSIFLGGVPGHQCLKNTAATKHDDTVGTRWTNIN